MAPFVSHFAPSGPTTQEYGILSGAGNDSTLASEWRFGWRFTVGAADIPVNKLRVFALEFRDYRVIVHRVSDGVTMATADITVDLADQSTWKETDITSVDLLSGVQYVVSARSLSGLPDVPRFTGSNPLVFNTDHITWDTYVYGNTVDAEPSTTTSARYFWADIGFLT